MRVPVQKPARRSCLAVPASSPRKLEKAAGLAADELVLDLEDAVAVAAKDEARAAAVEALADPRWSGRTLAVRVNAAQTPWHQADLAALAGLAGQPLSIVLPKVESAGDLERVDRLLDEAEAGTRERPLRVQALIETAAGLARIGEIAAASDRLEGLIIGYADLAASLGRSRAAAAELETWRPAQEAVLVAARANGLQAIDGPYLGIEPDEGFLAAARRASGLGFDGKWAIHPSQLQALNEIFTPDQEEVEHARAVIAALEQAEREGGAGAVALDGEMLDEALRARALRVLARAGEAADGTKSGSADRKSARRGEGSG
ncbi:MAG TPA: CoA ester lyase [Solirubrobacterales bacterium]|nr:CoA ester lyase [Solirubrobacterales bacterium]